jgi:hypothetical protein
MVKKTAAVIARRLQRSVAATSREATAFVVIEGMRLLVMLTRVLVLLT